MQRNTTIETARTDLAFDRLMGIAESQPYRLKLTTINGFGGKQLFFVRQFNDKVFGECFSYGVSRTMYSEVLPGYMWFEKRIYRGFTKTLVTGRCARSKSGEGRQILDTVFARETEAPFDELVEDFRAVIKKEVSRWECTSV